MLELVERVLREAEESDKLIKDIHGVKAAIASDRMCYLNEFGLTRCKEAGDRTHSKLINQGLLYGIILPPPIVMTLSTISLSATAVS